MYFSVARLKFELATIRVEHHAPEYVRTEVISVIDSFLTVKFAGETI